jgi:hypothetical protein
MTEMLGSVSRSQHFSIESAVLPSEVEQLPDLTGYLKYASEPTWQRVRLDARNKWAELRSGQVRTAQAGKERSQRFVDASRE